MLNHNAYIAVIVHGVANTTGVIMKIFAGINLHDFDIDDLSYRSMQQLQYAIVNNYKTHISFLRSINSHDRANVLQSFISGDKYSTAKSKPLIQHLIKYISMRKAETLSTDLDLAVAIKCIPLLINDGSKSKDAKLISMLRQAIIRHDYTATNYKELEKQIHYNHDSLNISNDWYDSVDTLSQAVSRENIRVAYYMLNNIRSLPQATSINKEDLSYILGLQLVYYLDIKNFLLRNIDRNEMIKFYTAIEDEINTTILKLKSLPEADAQIKKPLSWKGMFFTCIRTPEPTIIVPSKRLRHVDSANLRMY